MRYYHLLLAQLSSFIKY